MRSKQNRYIESQFQKIANGAYLNNAGVTLLPNSSMVKIKEYIDTRDNIDNFIGIDFIKELDYGIRNGFAQLINATKEEIAFTGSTADSVSKIAFGLNLGKDDSVLLARQEFPSNRLPWEEASRQNGFKIKWYDVPENKFDYTDTVLENIDKTTKLVAISSVQYLNGEEIDLTLLGNHCQNKNIYLFVDAIQQLGAFEIDINKYKIDFLVGATHKWMMGTIGIGLLYCRKDLIPLIQPRHIGWRSFNKIQFEDQHPTLSNNANRFETGIYNIAGAIALRESLKLMNQLGINKISEMILNKTNKLLQLLENIPEIVIALPYSNYKQRSGIICFSINNCEHAAEKLMAKNVHAVERKGRVRFSPNFYTADEEIDYAIEAVKSIIPAN